jgi:hypothetical protein
MKRVGVRRGGDCKILKPALRIQQPALTLSAKVMRIKANHHEHQNFSKGPGQRDTISGPDQDALG